MSVKSAPSFHISGTCDLVFLQTCQFSSYCKMFVLEREVEDTRRTWFTESTKQGSYRLTETKEASMGTARVCTRSSNIYIYIMAVSLVFLHDGEGVSLFFLHLGLLSSYWGALPSPHVRAFGLF